MIKADPETEHGDVDHPAIAPSGGGLTDELTRGGPACRLTVLTAAILHWRPFVVTPLGASLTALPTPPCWKRAL
jgi:hypothetical protein